MARRKGLPKPVARNYEGALGEPIYLSSPQTLANLGKTEDQRLDELVDYLRATQNAKIGLLFRHYQIDRDNEHAWFHLAMRLATDHVPGMKFVVGKKPRRGRKKSWQDGLGFELVREVAAIRKASTSLTTKAAIEKLRGAPQGKWGRYTPENLVTRHREAKRRHERIKPIVDALMRQPPGPVAPLPIMGGLLSLGASHIADGAGEPKSTENSRT